LTLLAVILALGAAAAWAVGMTLAKPALRHADPLTYMALRWIVVACLATTYGVLSGGLAFAGWRPIGLAVLAGVLDAVAGGLFYLLAMERTSAHRTTTLSSTTPLWGVVASVLFLAEPARWSAFAAAALVVGGAYFLVRERPGPMRGSLLGPAFGLATGVLWGVAETVPAKLALDAGMLPASFLLVFAATAVLGTLLITRPLRRWIPRQMDRAGALYAIASAAGGAFLGWVLWLSALERGKASLLAPVRGSTLLFAFALSVLFLRERPTGRALLGATLVFAGVLLVAIAQ